MYNPFHSAAYLVHANQIILNTIITGLGPNLVVTTIQLVSSFF